MSTLKYVNTEVVFREFPDEATLAINISGCPNHCKGCHSQYLWKDIGELLTDEELDRLISKNPGITCVGFMGGDQDLQSVVKLSEYVKSKYNLHTGLYSGKETFVEGAETFDYVKLGPWKEEFGPLNCSTTNQRLYKYDKESQKFIDITIQTFQAKRPWELLGL